METTTADTCGPTVLYTPDGYKGLLGPDKVLFVRHGEKEGSDSKADLTEAGRMAAFEAGKLLETHPDIILCSPKRRTVHTAECMRDGMGSDIRIEICDPLRGLPVRDRSAWSAIRKENGRSGAMDLWQSGQVPEETIPSFGEAAAELLGSVLSATPEGGCTVAVTHDHQIRFLARIMDIGPVGEIGYLDGIMLDREILSSRYRELKRS